MSRLAAKATRMHSASALARKRKISSLEEENSTLEVGTKAPEFTLPDQDGSNVSLSDLFGKKVMLYFYP